MPSELVELKGHILDSLLLPKVLDQIMSLGGDYKIEQIQVGHSRRDPSFARVRIDADTRELLSRIVEQISKSGAMVPEAPDAALATAHREGVFPEGFYSTTNLATEVRVKGAWIPVTKTKMDCGVTVDLKAMRAECTLVGDIRKGQKVVMGHEGVRVTVPPRVRESHGFEFMASEVSTEKPKARVIRAIAEEIRRTHREGRKVLLVGGPAIIHTGAGQYLERLIESHSIDRLFAGNALAAHDIEMAFFGTSLGVHVTSGESMDHGHEHHLRAINRIRECGSIAAAVQKGLLKTGVMCACVKHGVEFILAGSIRDDGPLPEVITDTQVAQRAMRDRVQDVGVALMVATTLHSVAVGNLLPATVKTVCVDINPAVVTKLSDRGTFQAIGLVTDVEPFLRELCRELNLKVDAKPAAKKGRRA